MPSNRSPFWNQVESKRTPSCATCRFCLRRDYGYSNVTTEGATFHCLLELNPKLDDQEMPYSEMTPELAEALDIAITCPRYRDGAPIWLDVDMEDIPNEIRTPTRLGRFPNVKWIYPLIESKHVLAYAADDEAEALVKWLNNYNKRTYT